MGVVRIKDGTQFSVIAPGGFRILYAIDRAAQSLGVDLIITSGTDGLHSGPNDPHHRGEAYDIRSHDFNEPQKSTVLKEILGFLPLDNFFGFLESPGTANEHFHIQLKKGTVFPPVETA